MHDGNPIQAPLLEDLRNHSTGQLAELHLLLSSGAPLRPDLRRSGFFEIDGDSLVFYICKYPSGKKVLLIAVWDRDQASQDGYAGNTEKTGIGEQTCVYQ